MSDDSLGFEPIDDDLRRRLGGAGPHPGDPDATLGALRPRFRRAKRRHQLLVAACSATVIAGIIGVGAAAFSTGGSDPQNVRIPAAGSTRPTGSSAPLPEPTTAPQPTAAPGPGGADNSATGTSVPVPATSAPVAPTSHTYASKGGSVTVKVDNGALSIVSTSAAAGFAEERHDTGPDRVEVRFTSDTTEWRIRVDIVNGQPVEEITQH